MIEDELYNRYVLIEIMYKKTLNENEINQYTEEELFPDDWYLSKDYKLKIEILLEATKNKTLIINTPKYQLIKERVIE